MNDELTPEESLADAAHSIAANLKWLGTGDASTHFGAIEAHSMMMGEVGKDVAAGLESVAGALHEIAEALRENEE